MKAKIEPAAATLRVFPDDARPGRDPYLFAATVIYHQAGQIAELRGVVTNGANLLEVKRAFMQEFRAAGVRTVIWQRQRAGQSKIVRLKL